MAESTVQKGARRGATRTSIGTCPCGGELIWVKLILRRPRIRKVCEQCGAIQDPPEA